MGFSESPASSPNGKASKRADANRQNAQKSTGPRTPEGKTRSSLNAVKHGLTAQTALLPGESYEELDALARSLHAQLKPVGALQRILAERVVSLTWKLRRCAAAEAEVGRQLRAEAVDPAAFHGFQRRYAPAVPAAGQLLAEEFLHPGNGQSLQRLTEYELKLETALRRTIQELRQLQKDKNSLSEGEDEARRAEEPAQASGVTASETPEATENEPTSTGATGAVASRTGREITPGRNEPIPPMVRHPEVAGPQPPPLPPGRN